MKTIPEIRSILEQTMGGPALYTAANDLLAHYDALLTAAKGARQYLNRDPVKEVQDAYVRLCKEIEKADHI